MKKTSQSTAPLNNASPGYVLKTFFMDPLGLTAYRVSKDTGISPIAISQILRGQRSVSAGAALKLGMYFGVEPDFWLNLQSHMDLAREAKRAPRITLCAVLNGRSFVLKEAKSNGSRHWQVLMMKTRHNGGVKKG